MQRAMIGLGRMGGNMVRRLVQGGHDLVVYDQSADQVKATVAKGVKAAKNLADVAHQLAPRRVVWVMVPAGAVESTIEQLVPHLARGDIVIDGGNSNFRDSLRRAEALKAQGIELVDVGTSGGIWGLRRAAHDPYDSRVALRLMQALEASGNRAGALPYWDLAEKLNIPVGVHTGLSFPGITQRPAPMGAPNFRVALGNPILFEGMLLAETIGILSVYPEVYVDIAVINWILPREEFYAYLKALIRAGFADRIMFGSDQMAWPDAIGLTIDAIESAEFLTQQQKRGIFYNNAARFLKLSPEQIRRHHGR